MLVLILPEESRAGLEERHACDRLMVDLKADVVVRDGSLESVPAGATFVAIVTDPLFVPGSELLLRLARHLDMNPGVLAAIPAASFSPAAIQRIEMTPDYSTPSEFVTSTNSRSPVSRRIRWPASVDPALVLLRAEALPDTADILQRLHDGDVLLCEDAVIHRFEPLRGNRRDDLFDQVPVSCQSFLEIGCGEGSLGEQIKSARGGRVVGIEPDPAAAAIAATRLDHVHVGRIEEVLDHIEETFECIIAGDVLEHLVDPWTTLRELRRNLAPGGVLVASIPNIASLPVIADLLRGRFDYVYGGLLCSGHLRFFTRASIVEMFTIAGWNIRSIQPQEGPEREEHIQLKNLLSNVVTDLSADLSLRGFIVIANLDNDAR